MARPSIFSREYERRMRRRKRRIFIGIIILIFGASAFFMFNKFNFYEYSKKLLTDTKKNTNNTQLPEDKNKATTPSVEEIKENAFDITLNENTKIKAVYETNNGINTFKSIFTENPSISFSVNPSATGMVILDSALQSMWYLNNSGALTEITNQGYKSYSKASVLQKRPDYIWCTAPKFIDDENIAYLSQLPYIGRSTKKYVWAVNINNKDKHTSKTSLGGETISFGNITDKGLEVIIGSSTRYIKYNGTSIQVAK